MKRKIGIMALFLFSALCLTAQEAYDDQLVKRDGTIIQCKVVEIGDDEIKYKDDYSGGEILMGIDKIKVEKIILSDGREINISDPMENKEEYGRQRKNGLKFNMFMPISGATAFGYERSIKPSMSFESEIGIINSGQSAEMSMDAKGLFIKTGIKLIRSPDFYLKGMKYSHLLKGAYVKPELALTTFTFDKSKVAAQLGSGPGLESGSVAKVAVLLNFGKQLVYNNRYVVDWFIGGGYNLGKKEESLRYFAFTGGGGTSFVGSGGVRVGFLFK